MDMNYPTNIDKRKKFLLDFVQTTYNTAAQQKMTIPQANSLLESLVSQLAGHDWDTQFAVDFRRAHASYTAGSRSKLFRKFSSDFFPRIDVCDAGDSGELATPTDPKKNFACGAALQHPKFDHSALSKVRDDVTPKPLHAPDAVGTPRRSPGTHAASAYFTPFTVTAAQRRTPRTVKFDLNVSSDEEDTGFCAPAVEAPEAAPAGALVERFSDSTTLSALRAYAGDKGQALMDAINGALPRNAPRRNEEILSLVTGFLQGLRESLPEEPQQRVSTEEEPGVDSQQRAEHPADDAPAICPDAPPEGTQQPGTPPVMPHSLMVGASHMVLSPMLNFSSFVQLPVVQILLLAAESDTISLADSASCLSKAVSIVAKLELVDETGLEQLSTYLTHLIVTDQQSSNIVHGKLLASIPKTVVAEATRLGHDLSTLEGLFAYVRHRAGINVRIMRLNAVARVYGEERSADSRGNGQRNRQQTQAPHGGASRQEGRHYCPLHGEGHPPEQCNKMRPIFPKVLEHKKSANVGWRDATLKTKIESLFDSGKPAPSAQRDASRGQRGGSGQRAPAQGAAAPPAPREADRA